MMEQFTFTDVLSTLNLLNNEQCSAEFKLLQQQVSLSVESKDCHELSTYWEGAPQSMETQHCTKADASTNVGTSDFQFHNVQNYYIDTNQDSEQLNDSEDEIYYIGTYQAPEQLNDSGDEMLTVHFEQDNVENKFVCQVCHKSYKNLSSFKQHELKHLEESTYTCTLCGYVGKDMNALKSHKLDHAFKHRCPLCDYSSNRPSKVKHHLQFHTNDAPNKCKLCQYSTIKPRALIRHYTYHHLRKTEDVTSPLDKQVDKQTSHYSKTEDVSIPLDKQVDKQTSHYSKTEDVSISLDTSKHADSQYRHNTDKHLLLQSSCLVEQKRNHLKESVKHQLSISERNQDTSSSSVSRGNKCKSTMRNSVTSFQGKTHTISSRLQHRKRMLSHNISHNHCDKKLKIHSESKSVKLHKSSQPEVQNESTLHKSNKDTISTSLPQREKQKRSMNSRSFTKKTNSVHSPLQLNKQILYKKCSVLMSENITQMLTTEQQHKHTLCEFCGSFLNSLKVQTNSHKEMTVSTCDNCHKTCKSFGNLKICMPKYNPLVMQPYKCTVCEYSCKMLETFNRHIAEHAADKQSKECDQERKSQNCDNTTTLQSHLSSHVEEKVCDIKKAVLYRCVLCQFKNEGIESMKKHLLNCKTILGLW